MEYRFEADGESFCDPANRAARPGAFGEKSVIEFPGYAPPAWLARARPRPGPSPSPSTRGSGRRPTPTRAGPLPLLVAHDGTEYERLAQLTRLIAHAIATGRIPPCRVALLDAPTATRLLRLRPLRPHARRPPPPARAGDRHRRPRREPRRAGPAARALAAPGRVRRADAAVGLVLPPALGPPGVRLPALPPHLAASSARSCTPARAATPIPITLTCGAPEENLANNRAVAAALRRQGHDVGAARQPRRAQLRRLARHARPAPRRPARAGLGVGSPADGAHAPDRAAARHRGGLVGRLRGAARPPRPVDRARRRAARVRHRARHDRAVRPAHARRATRSSSTASRTGTTSRASGSRRSR